MDTLIAQLRELVGGTVRGWRTDGERVRPLGAEGGGEAWWPQLKGEAPHAIETPSGSAWLHPVPGSPGVWLQLGPDDTDPATRKRRAAAAAQVLSEALAAERECALMAEELAARYEEIDLLYTISDILGRTVRLEEAAHTIVKEVATVVGARRASIMVYDEAARVLRVVAGRGIDVSDFAPVSVDEPDSVAARAFRERRLVSYDPADVPAAPPPPPPPPAPAPVEPPPRARVPDRVGTGRASGRAYRGRSFLSVPILYGLPGSTEGTSRPVGVVNLTDRLGGDAFTAGNKKLLTAIASQIGAAIENARLVREERQRERLLTELELAHNFQLALLPAPAVLGAAGDVAARCRPAESVGGDFYHLIRLGDGSVGVLMGDVATHGMGAALLMAHAISAAGILAESARSPEEMLQRLHHAVGDELARTEMFVSLFYGVVEAKLGRLRYANAGHPQAFVVPVGMPAERLGATAPPLGLGDAKEITRAERRWHAGGDVLCLFTDGISDAVNAAGERYGEQRLLALVAREHRRPMREILDEAFRDHDAFIAGPPADDRTLLLLRL